MMAQLGQYYFLRTAEGQQHLLKIAHRDARSGTRSEIELARHLDRSRSARAGDLPESSAAEARVRNAPLRAVGHAVGLQPQLNVFPFRDVEVLHQGRIFVDDAGPAICGEESRGRADQVRPDLLECAHVEVVVELVARGSRYGCSAH